MERIEKPTGGLARRSFFGRCLTFIAGLIVTAIPASLAAVFLANPWYRRTPVGESQNATPQDGFIPLAIAPEAVPGDGTPIPVSIVTNTTDAWNHFPAQSIGNIWLRRDEKSNLIAFSSVCPHLGCRVTYCASRDRHFYCPCHDSQFTLDGEPTNRIPPRPMDRLEIRQAEGRIWVRYLEFRGGLPEKIPV